MSNNGSKLWLRYDPLGAAEERHRATLRQVAVAGRSPTARVIREELTRGLSSLLGVPVEAAELGPLVVGTTTTSPLVRDLNWSDDLKAAGPDGFVIRSATVGEQPTTVIA